MVGGLITSGHRSPGLLQFGIPVEIYLGPGITLYIPTVAHVPYQTGPD